MTPLKINSMRQIIIYINSLLFKYSNYLTSVLSILLGIAIIILKPKDVSISFGIFLTILGIIRLFLVIRKKLINKF